MPQIVYLIFALVLVITLHEFAHAYVANALGDPTPAYRGRVSLNPLAHLDPLGTLLMFLVGIGWGKPVPVNRSYFSNPLAHEALVAVAGPLMNLMIALVVMLPVKYFSIYLNVEMLRLLVTVFDVSVLLFAFNMLPFPPLDGSKFLQLLMPKRWEHHYQWYLANTGMYFMIFVLVDNLLLARYLNFSVLGWLMGGGVVILKTLLFLGG